MTDERKIKLIVAYEGTRYSGWQRQEGQSTIQGEIESVLSSVTGREIIVRGASRTDAGVHADGQVVTFMLENSPIPTQAFTDILNSKLPPDIAIRSSIEVAKDFHPSQDAICKSYLYRFYDGADKDVEFYNRRWHVPFSLDPEPMNHACRYLLGTHDHIGFASAKDQRDNTVRTIVEAKTYRKDDEIRFVVKADRFLYHMVRNIAGTLAEIGRGHWPAEKIAEIIQSRDRTQAGRTAPANGLCLKSIEYP